MLIKSQEKIEPSELDKILDINTGVLGAFKIGFERSFIVLNHSMNPQAIFDELGDKAVAFLEDVEATASFIRSSDHAYNVPTLKYEVIKNEDGTVTYVKPEPVIPPTLKDEQKLPKDIK